MFRPILTHGGDPQSIRRAGAPLALIAPATAGAEPGWPKSVALGDGYPGQVLIDARGDVLAVWGHYEGSGRTSVHYAWKSPGGDWTPPRTLPGTTHADVPGTYRLTCLVHPTTMGQTVRVR